MLMRFWLGLSQKNTKSGAIQWNVVERNTRISAAITKCGVVSPVIAIIRNMLSSHVSGNRAERMPRGMPMSIDPMSPMSPSCTLAGMRDLNTSTTRFSLE